MLSGENAPVRFGNSSRQSIAHYSSRSTYHSFKVFQTIYQTGLRIADHRGHKFPPPLTLLSSETGIDWLSVLTAAVRFLSVFFKLSQYSRQFTSLTAHRAALMTKT